MTKKITLIALLFIANASIAQNRTDSLLINLSSKTESLESVISLLMTENAKFRDSKELNKQLWIEKNGPWLIALVVGLLTIMANVIINRKQRIAQLRVTLKTKNRQDWINELRHSITELTTQCKMINIEFQDKSSPDEKKKPLHEKITFHRTKLLLLLDPTNNNHSPLLEAIGNLLNILDQHLFHSKHDLDTFDNLDFMNRTNRVIELGTKLSYYEWKEIQKHEE